MLFALCLSVYNIVHYPSLNLLTSLLHLPTNTRHYITIINLRPFQHQRAFFIYFLCCGGVVVGRYNLSVMVHARSFITIYHSSSQSSSVGSTRPGIAILYIAVSTRLSVSAVTDSFSISSFSSATVNCNAIQQQHVPILYNYCRAQLINYFIGIILYYYIFVCDVFFV